MRNVIWIFGDQHRGQDLGCTENDQIRTPNIDSLAPCGKTAIAGSPLCTPFRSALLTGRYPHHGAGGHDVELPSDSTLIAEVLGAAEYHTAYFGKWHVDGAVHRQPNTSPGRQTVSRARRGGFHTWLGYENNNAQYDCWLHGHDDDGNERAHFKLERYETDALTDLFVDHLETRAQDRSEAGEPKPFFAALSVQPPHCPYVAPSEWEARWEPECVQLRPNVPPVSRVVDEAKRDLAGYYAMIENLDWNVGRILAALKQFGLHDNTVVMFFSDHGDMHGSHGQILKCSPYEESIRIPFMVGGAVTQSDAVRQSCPSIVNHVDITATTLGLCGVDSPAEMDGVDYSGHFMVERALPKEVPESAFLQLVDPGFVHGFAVDRERPWRGIVTADGWKYAVLERQPWLMFNLNEDPFEFVNLAMDRRFADKRRALQAQLLRWLERTNDRFELPAID